MAHACTAYALRCISALNAPLAVHVMDTPERAHSFLLFILMKSGDVAPEQPATAAPGGSTSAAAQSALPPSPSLDHLVRLFVGWVPLSYTEEDVRPHFEQVLPHAWWGQWSLPSSHVRTLRMHAQIALLSCSACSD
jgi:hypothetical protein